MAVRTVKPLLPEEYLVDNRVYTDPRVFEIERDKIFLRVWNFVCHESEIPRPGDYITTTVGQQSIIVCRNVRGEIRAFFNTCRHRAAQVVLAKGGNSRAFTCLYHLWTYDFDGRLISVPQDEAYKTSFCVEGLEKGTMGLVPVRIESMHRLVFVCFDDEAGSLAEFLGPIADELRETFSSPDARVEVMWSKILPANWKMQPENSRDGYHATLLHKRLRGVSAPGPFKILAGGHAIQRLGLDYDAGKRSKTLDGVLLEQPELAEKFMAYPLPGLSREDPSRIVTLFPDILIALRFSTVLLVRQVPLNAGETLLEARQLYLHSDAPDVREIRRQHWLLYWSLDGGNLPEDWAAWEAQQKGVQSIGVRYSLLARGEPSDIGIRGDDNRIRAFWSQWRHYMGTSTNGLPERALS
jgi:phenylpropionate dioxygenase-like ring-hydroxylating dioxygenase large terminal subunit